MKVYIVLMNRMERRIKGLLDELPWESSIVNKIFAKTGVHIVDVIQCNGDFEAILICRGPDNDALPALLNMLDGWRAEVVRAISHVRYEMPYGSIEPAWGESLTRK